MLRWLILLTLFAHNNLAFGLYDEIDDYHLWRRGGPSTSTKVDKDCIKDILVIWDNSQSVGTGNFLDKVRPFLKKLVRNDMLNVGEDGTHIGFITFASGDKTRELLKIGSITSQDKLIKWLDGLNYVKDLMGSWTYTGKAFKLAANDVFPSKSPLNHRDDVGDVILLFTDGEPRARTRKEIKKQLDMADKYSTELKNRNVSIISLAVGPEAKKKKFQSNIRLWSNHMFTSGFNDLDSVLAKIIKASCAAKPAGCSCDGNISSYQYTKPGENKLLFRWEKPKLTCDKPVNEKKTVNPPGAQSPQEFGRGKHVITYTFSYEDRNKKLVSHDCFVNLMVGACKCPSSQTVSEQVKPGQTKASVSWLEPVPTCPTTPSSNNPQSTSGWFSAGEHTLTYKYKHSTKLHSFDIQCHVKIVVTGKYCGDTAYDPATHVCCCGKAHKKKSGYECCGTNYYNPSNKICCQNAILVPRGGKCP